MAQNVSWLGRLSDDDGTASASSGAATLNTQSGTLNTQSGVITTESITTAAGSDYTLALTNSFIGTGSNVLVTVEWGSNTQGTHILKSVTPAAGSVSIVIRNNHASVAFNGTLKVRFLSI